jgi:hypothetical protein
VETVVQECSDCDSVLFKMYLWRGSFSYHYKYLHKWKTMKETRQWLMTIWALTTSKGEMRYRYLGDLGICSVKLGDWFTMLYHYSFNHTYMSYVLVSIQYISKFRKQGKPTSCYLSSGKLHILTFWGSFFISFIHMCLQC